MAPTPNSRPPLTSGFYIVLRTFGSYGLKARMTTKLPALAAGEVVVKVNIEVPVALFERPQLQATIVVPASDVSAPVIDAKVQDNIAAALSEQLGIRVEVSAATPE